MSQVYTWHAGNKIVLSGGFICPFGRPDLVRSDNVLQVNGRRHALRYNRFAMKKPSLLSRLFSDDRNYERPFFLFLTLVMVGIYAAALINSPLLRTAWKIALFTVLMAVHIALYWGSVWVFEHRRWLAVYFILQLLIAFCLGMMCQVTGVIIGLYPGLIGLFISAPTRRIWKAVIILAVLAVSAFNFAWLAGLGTLFRWLLVTIPVMVFTSIYVLMYVRQAEAREQAQALLKDLEVANRQLSEYAARVEDLTIANERQRMARELHDTLSQGLAGLILQLEAVDAHLAGNRADRGRTILKQAMEKARNTLADARKAIDDLRATAPRDLEDAVRQEAERFTIATGIAYTQEVNIATRPSKEIAETAIRAVSEGLTNIARHAKAKHVLLRLTGTDNEFDIQMSDDGIGFDPEAVQAGHYGLLGMRERVRLAGGSFDISSRPGEGTRIVIRFPLENS
jgi:two-component system, NarL family, sensor histidine kinase YdfH